MNRIIFFFLLVFNFFPLFVTAQIIDNYGLRLGLGLSSQYWDYHYAIYEKLDNMTDTKMGVAFHVFGEKKINPIFSLRPEIGYVQKGSISNQTAVSGLKTTLHNVSMGGGLKCSPITSKRIHVRPYLIAGLRCDLLLAKSTENTFIQSRLDNFSPVNVGGLFGIGVAVHDLAYFDFEYNPNITKTLNEKDLTIKDQYFAFTLGLNVKQLVNPEKKKK